MYVCMYVLYMQVRRNTKIMSEQNDEREGDIHVGLLEREKKFLFTLENNHNHHHGNFMGKKN